MYNVDTESSTLLTNWVMLKSVTRIGLHIDYVIMYLCNEEDKDNKMYFCYACFMSFMSKVFIIGQKTTSWCLLGICHIVINVLIMSHVYEERSQRSMPQDLVI